MEPLEPFRRAGRTLYSLGLVRGTDGNLSTFDDSVLRITRTGAPLGELEDGDVVDGGLDGSLDGASTDLAVHRAMYAERGPGAVAHAHPPGTVPDEGVGPGKHGVYVFGSTLDEAVAEAVRLARTEAREATRIAESNPRRWAEAEPVRGAESEP